MSILTFLSRLSEFNKLMGLASSLGDFLILSSKRFEIELRKRQFQNVLLRLISPYKISL